MKSGKNKRSLRALYYAIIAGCIIGAAYQYSSKIILLSQKRQLKNRSSKKIVYGNVREISHIPKSTRKWISYRFSYNNESYNNKIMDVFYSKCKLNYDERLFPIVIDSLHPETNFILFHKRDYIYFGYPVPDSMNWLFNCVEPSGSYIFSPAPISPK